MDAVFTVSSIHSLSERVSDLSGEEVTSAVIVDQVVREQRMKGEVEPKLPNQVNDAEVTTVIAAVNGGQEGLPLPLTRIALRVQLLEVLKKSEDLHMAENAPNDPGPFLKAAQNWRVALRLPGSVPGTSYRQKCANKLCPVLKDPFLEIRNLEA